MKTSSPNIWTVPGMQKGLGLCPANEGIKPGSDDRCSLHNLSTWMNHKISALRKTPCLTTNMVTVTSNKWANVCQAHLSALLVMGTLFWSSWDVETTLAPYLSQANLESQPVCIWTGRKQMNLLYAIVCWEQSQNFKYLVRYLVLQVILSIFTKCCTTEVPCINYWFISFSLFLFWAHHQGPNDQGSFLAVFRGPCSDRNQIQTSFLFVIFLH